MDYEKFSNLAPTDYAGALKRESFIDFGIKALWQPIPRISGPAYTVEMAPGDNLMLHVAIYEAPVGSIIVANTHSMDFAVAGGNVCAIAQKRGIAGFIIDGLVRDIGEIREAKFPVFARGVIPMPGIKKEILPLNQTITCGGINVNSGDIIVADEEGIAVIPKDKAQDIYTQAKNKADKEASLTLEEWEENHHKIVQKHLHRKD